MSIVVVGASGNIGTAVLRRLHKVLPDTPLIGVCRRLPTADGPYRGVQWAELDVAEPAAVERLAELFRDAQAVVSLSWLLQPSHDQLALHRTNVHGTAHVVEAVLRAGVPHLVYVSSIGTYGPGPDGAPVDESWPHTGIGGSSYSTDKAEVELLLDRVERDHPELLVSRARPALVMQRGAASEIMRYFVGPLLPAALFRLVDRGQLPVLPLPAGVRVQLVHADDVAAALVEMIRLRRPGAFNLAAEPSLTTRSLAAVLGAKLAIPVPLFLVRGLVNLTWRLRLQPTSPGWIDLAGAVPTMSSARARAELNWTPDRTADDALREIVHGMADGSGEPSPALRPRHAPDELRVPVGAAAGTDD